MKLLRYFLMLTNLFIWSFSSVSASATALEVMPVHLHITQQTPTDALTVFNKGDKPVLIQANIVKWSQSHEKDNYQKSNDLIVNPPIFTILPNDSQVIRVGLRNGWKAINQENSYRLYLQEVDKQLKHSPGVRTLLRLSLPVFIMPADQTAEKTEMLRWYAEKNNQGKLVLHAVNQGNRHVQISQLNIKTSSSEKPLVDQIIFAYVLPRQTKTWIFNLPEYKINSPLKITAETDSGKITADAKISV